MSRVRSELTCLDRAGREGCCHLLRNGANAIGGKGFLSRCQHSHDKLKEAGGDIEFLVKEDATQERFEETVYNGISETLFLHQKLK